MRLKAIQFREHPVLGDLELNFLDNFGDTFDTIILAGGNGTGKTSILNTLKAVLEGRQSPTSGSTTLVFLMDEEDVARLAEVQGGPKRFGGPVTEFTVAYRHNVQRGQDYSLTWFDPQSGPNGTLHLYLQTPEWQNVFRVFYSEASVDFTVHATNSSTALDVDNPYTHSDRSGVQLGAQINQLLIDARAADAEDMLQWIDTHPNIVPPPAVKGIRLSRFANAFNYMFPAKRFKGVKRRTLHVGQHVLAVEFEENGRISTINELSTGEKQIVFRGSFFLRNLAMTRSSLILIDEPELSLHPEWQERIMGFYRLILGDAVGKHPQMIVATHSPFIVQAAANARIVILEKDQTSGIIREMTNPAYLAVGGMEAVHAFNIDSFLTQSKQRLLVLTEGESDVKILMNAWAALRQGRPRPFELRAALGAKNINITLNDDQLFSKMGDRLVLGIFDFDDAYNHWKGVWKSTSRLVSSSAGAGLVKRSDKGRGWAILLPVPVSRAGFASASLAGSSILSIEFLFNDNDFPAGMVGYKQIALGQKTPYISDSQKMGFATHTETLPATSFANFEPLLARLEDILAGHI